MARTHYHVIHGMEGGYLPYESSYCTTLADARNAARFTLDGYEPEDRVSGSLKSRRWIIDTGRSLRDYVDIDACAFDCDSNEE